MDRREGGGRGAGVILLLNERDIGRCPDRGVVGNDVRVGR